MGMDASMDTRTGNGNRPSTATGSDLLIHEKAVHFTKQRSLVKMLDG
jgi:hypothetical protein